MSFFDKIIESVQNVVDSDGDTAKKGSNGSSREQKRKTRSAAANAVLNETPKKGKEEVRNLPDSKDILPTPAIFAKTTTSKTPKDQTSKLIPTTSRSGVVFNSVSQTAESSSHKTTKKVLRAAPPLPGGFIEYVALENDTAVGVAVKYGMSLSEFRQVNRLTGFGTAQIYPGQVLFVRDMSTGKLPSNPDYKGIKPILQVPGQAHRTTVEESGHSPVSPTNPTIPKPFTVEKNEHKSPTNLAPPVVHDALYCRDKAMFCTEEYQVRGEITVTSRVLVFEPNLDDPFVQINGSVQYQVIESLSRVADCREYEYLEEIWSNAPVTIRAGDWAYLAIAISNDTDSDGNGTLSPRPTVSQSTTVGALTWATQTVAAITHAVSVAAGLEKEGEMETQDRAGSIIVFGVPKDKAKKMMEHILRWSIKGSESGKKRVNRSASMEGSKSRSYGLRLPPLPEDCSTGTTPNYSTTITSTLSPAISIDSNPSKVVISGSSNDIQSLYSSDSAEVATRMRSTSDPAALRFVSRQLIAQSRFNRIDKSPRDVTVKEQGDHDKKKQRRKKRIEKLMVASNVKKKEKEEKPMPSIEELKSELVAINVKLQGGFTYQTGHRHSHSVQDIASILIRDEEPKLTRSVSKGDPVKDDCNDRPLSAPPTRALRIGHGNDEVRRRESLDQLSLESDEEWEESDKSSEMGKNEEIVDFSQTSFPRPGRINLDGFKRPSLATDHPSRRHDTTKRDDSHDFRSGLGRRKGGKHDMFMYDDHDLLFDSIGEGDESAHFSMTTNPSMIGYTHTPTLTDDEARQLRAELPPRFQRSHWRLLYSTREHGISLQTFYIRCFEIAPTVIVLTDSDGFCFGGFATKPWRSRYERVHYGTGEAFLFTMRPKFRVYNWTKKNSYFQVSGKSFMGMGGGKEGNGLWLDKEFIRGASHASDTFGNPILSARPQFECASVECWTFDAYR